MACSAEQEHLHSASSPVFATKTQSHKGFTKVAWCILYALVPWWQ
jgi:hypothetical protein